VRSTGPDPAAGSVLQWRPVQVSVVLPVLNGLPFIHEQLVALARQEQAPSWELILADNGSTDGTLEAVQGDLDRLGIPVTVIDASDLGGQAHARNKGARAARGAKIVFVDQDDVVCANYLSAMADALDRDALVAATMDYEALNPVWTLRARRASLTSGLRTGLYPWAYGCSLGVLRQVFEQVGGFDESFPCAEDIDFCWRVQREGGSVIHLVEEAQLRYRLKQSVRGLARQGFMYGRGGPPLYRRWRRYGMQERPVRTVVLTLTMALVAVGRDRDRGAIGAAAFLLGNNLGHLVQSWVSRTLYL
jgi:GT2 family glycosyltransferase